MKLNTYPTIVWVAIINSGSLGVRNIRDFVCTWIYLSGVFTLNLYILLVFNPFWIASFRWVVSFGKSCWWHKSCITRPVRSWKQNNRKYDMSSFKILHTRANTWYQYRGFKNSKQKLNEGLTTICKWISILNHNIVNNLSTDCSRLSERQISQLIFSTLI